MRELSKSQPAALVPIDITGSGFTRMCQYRESIRASSREYLKNGSQYLIPDDAFQEVQDSAFCVKSADDLRTYSASKERWESQPKAASSEKQISRDQRGRQSRRPEQKERSKSADKMLEEEIPQNSMLKRAHSIRQSLKSLFRSKSRSRSRDLWVDKKPVLPGPPVIQLGTTVPRSKSLPRTLKMAVSPSSASTVEHEENKDEHNTSIDSDEATNTLGLRQKNKDHVFRIPKHQNNQPDGSTFHGQFEENHSLQKSSEKLSRKPIPVASPTTPSTESLPSVSSSKASSSQGAPPTWADVRLRQNNKYKDDRQSSSGIKIKLYGW